MMFCRLKLLSKQVDDGHDLRKQLSETVNDLQRQLTNERDENKKMKKRYTKQQICCYYHLSFCMSLSYFLSDQFPYLKLIHQTLIIIINFLFFINFNYNLSEFNYWK